MFKSIFTLVFALSCHATNGATFQDNDAKFVEDCASKKSPPDKMTQYLCSLRNPNVDETPKSNLPHLMVWISGELRPGDERQLMNGYLKRLKKGGTLQVDISSDGGDINTAILIGKLLRQHEARVTSNGRCLSACVFVLIGGVDRTVTTNASRGAGVGLHRPYFGSLAPDLSSLEISQKREQLRAEIVRYLRQMNVTDRLLDLMEAVPPEKMKMLSETEVDDLGLSGSDPVWDERTVAKESSYYGISSAEYRKRKVITQEKCKSPYDPKASMKANVERSKNYSDCTEATLYGLTIKDYGLRNERYKAWSKAYAEIVPRNSDGEFSPASRAFALKCSLLMMNLNAQTCDR